MGNWIGEMAGFFMLLLIGALFLVMLEEFKIIGRDNVVELKRIAIYAFLSGIAYVWAGGLFYNASIGTGGIMEYDKIWNYGNYALVMAGAESGSCPGLFNAVYVKAAHVMGKIFFGQYLSSAMYTSFLLAVIFALIVSEIENRLFGREQAHKLLPFTFIWPFSYKLFLPSPASCMCCIFGGIVLAVLCIKKQHKTFKARISTGWCYQIAVCLMCAANIMIYYTEIVGRK